MPNNKTVEVWTKFGKILVEEAADPDDPGIWVSLVKPGGWHAALVTVEETKNIATGKTVLRSVIWGDEADEDPTDIIEHKLIKGEI